MITWQKSVCVCVCVCVWAGRGEKGGRLKPSLLSPPSGAAPVGIICKESLENTFLKSLSKATKITFSIFKDLSIF